MIHVTRTDELAGIPGTFLDDAARRLRWLEDGVTPLPFGDGRRYRADVADGQLRAIVSRDAAGRGGKPLWHVSVSHKARKGLPPRYPTWDELKSAAYRLVQADVCLVLIFPRRSTPRAKYVNVSETCLHLWESEEGIDQ